MPNISDDTRLLLFALAGSIECRDLHGPLSAGKEKGARAENPAGRVRNISHVHFPDSVCDSRVLGICCDVGHRQPALLDPDDYKRIGCGHATAVGVGKESPVMTSIEVLFGI